MSNTDVPVKVHTFSPNTTMLSAQVNQNFDDLFTGLANIGTANLLTDAITTAKVLDGQITLAKLAAAVQAALCPTGTVVAWAGITTAPSGWLFLDGTSIGNASSAATGRANADTETLFTLLYNAMADAQAPVSGGRGASAAADFAANKRLTLPNAKGRTIAGKESSESNITTAVSGFSGATMGATGGSQSHQLTTGEIPAHQHAVADHNHTITEPNAGAGNNHGFTGVDASSTVAAGTGADPFGAYRATAFSAQVTNNGVTAISINNKTGLVTATDGGSGGVHKNVQPTIILNWIIKL